MPEPGIMSDRRCRKRKDLAARQIRVELGLTGGVIADLSEAGISVRTAEPLKLKPGEKLHVSIPDSHRPIQAGCELAWTDANSAGMRFLVLSESSQRSIMDWLNADSGETIWVPAAHPAPIKNAITTPARVIAPGTASQEPAITGASASPTTAGVSATSPLNGLAVPPTAQNAAIRAEAAKSIATASEPRGEVALRFQTGLRLVAKLAQIMTSAEGAAIALISSSQDPRAANAGQMICRASNGRAPEAGALVWTGSGITGECLRSRSMVRCEDTHVDPRVDAEACRALQVRSIVATPIFSGETILGILEVLSGAVRGFDESGIRLLPTLAALVSHLARTAGAVPENSTIVPAATGDHDLAHLAQSIKTQLVDQEQGRVNVNPRAIWPRANG